MMKRFASNKLFQKRRRPLATRPAGMGPLTRRMLQTEILEERRVLATGPLLAAILPNDGVALQANEVRHIAPTELTFRFGANQVIDPESLDGIRITRAGEDGALATPDDITVQTGYVAVGDHPNEVIVRFAQTLPDDDYKIEIFGSGANPLTNIAGEAFNNGVNYQLQFTLDLGAQIVGVVPQPVTHVTGSGSSLQLSHARNRIDVYFNDDDLNPVIAGDRSFYQLVFTNGTVTTTDDVVHTPINVQYDSANDMASLTFASNIEDLATGPGVYRLRVGTDVIIPSAPAIQNTSNDPGDQFTSALGLGSAVGPAGHIITSSIDPQPLAVVLPGSNDDPGHRDIRVNLNQHILNGTADEVDGISEILYNFRDVYGLDPQGNELFNTITERQKERAREVFEIYGNYFGVQFVETPDLGFTIVTGDLRALEPTVPTGTGGETGLAGEIDDFGPTAIMDAAEAWGNDFGGSWFFEAMRQVGFLLGLGATFDLPDGGVMGSDPRLTFGAGAEPIFPGDADILHGQYLYRPDSIDIDLYRFDVTEEGRFTAETFAERLSDSSRLDTYIRLYEDTPDGPRVIAQNDDYFSEDSFLQLTLAPGTYYIGVSASGNDQYDPTIANSGYGGTTQGRYELRLDFRPEADRTLVDLTGTALDGDGDGIPGGEYNFWFQAVPASDTIYVDKLGTAAGNGTLASPYRTISAALAAAQPGQVVRLAANGGADRSLVTVSDNQPYQLGFNSFGGALADGTSMIIPQGVTVMVEPGAIFKMRRSIVSVGSSTSSVDRSNGALQLLGTPSLNVVFTSAKDEAIGVDIESLVTSPARGDWGGIVFQENLDRAEGREEIDSAGIFLNYVGQTDLRYGGGVVFVDSLPQVVTPIQIIDSRPTIVHNSITTSADAAISATPNSFREDNFHAPAQQTTRFTSDYSRVGPEIHGNHIVANTLNGLFVNVDTPSGGQLEHLTTDARWDDTDIVHILGEALVVESTPGGPIRVAGNNDARLDASLKIDPGVIVKSEGARIEVQMGATFYAEGTAERPIIMTALADDRYGAGGTYETNSNPEAPVAGDWAGIALEHLSTGSIDHAVIAYGGGIVRVEGTFTAFNAVEVHQADARITNSVFENNARGVGGAGVSDRFGRGANAPGTIFVRGAQPVIASNQFRDNAGSVININVNALNYASVLDGGRMTGSVDRIDAFRDNQGPLVRGNMFSGNDYNAMQVRGGTVTTEVVWDDTDIVHFLRDGVYITDVHTFGGVRLESSTTSSLVVKMLGAEAGFVTTGRPLEITDRSGGQIQVVGQPGFPVVMTSISDDTVGAGLDLAGNLQTDTNNGGRPTRERDDNGEPIQEFDIDIQFGPIILQFPEIVDAVNEAVALWEQEISDPIQIIFDFDIGPLGVGVLGGAAAEFVALGYDEVRSRMIADAKTHESVVNGLPTFDELNVTLPQLPPASGQFTVNANMLLTTANAKALGFTDVNVVPSQYNPGVMRDGDILFTDNLQRFDFNRKDGVLPNRNEFIGVVVHEIGHALGFDSSVDDVDLALANAAAPRDILLRPFDLFRLAPGAGLTDFTNASRQLDPRFTDHVFYDGGLFDPAGLPIDGVQLGDIPLATGQNFGDGNQASHWKDDSFLNGTVLGMMDPVSTQNVFQNLRENDRVAFDLIGWDIVGGGGPGDWMGLKVQQFSNDRNVAVAIERETANASSSLDNGTPLAAQFLGQLAADEKAGNDQQRVGYEVQGLINQPSDVDVYSFSAKAGTRVWLDIDSTTFALDSVLELVSASGQVLARSDNSQLESQNDGLLTGSANPQPFTGLDHYSTNPRDAGMQLVLPGTAGTTNTYYVRVRSSSENLTDLSGGLTEGQYQLQIRLHAQDEHPGVSIDYADVRFAEVGLEIIGMPTHSPLLVEAVEDESFNDQVIEFPVQVGNTVLDEFFLPDTVQYQDIGNLLNSDRGAIGVFGTLDTATDIDWYLIEVRYDVVGDIPGVTTNDPKTAGVVFDIDYADGLARPNMTMSIFDGSGTLQYFSDSSNVGADRPGPGQGNGLTDLSRGTVGLNDPYIGPVVLEEGFYFVMLSSIAVVPTPIVDGTTQRQPIITGLQDRGERVLNAQFDVFPSLNPNVPENALLTGEYQLEIRYAPVPEDGFNSSNAFVADANRMRDQGQIIVRNSSFRDSMQWGIRVDDGLRDQPFYGTFEGPKSPALLYPQQPFAHYNAGDYVPHSSTPAALVELNKERIVPGIVIENNVIAGGIEGGIHFKGDPNGFVMHTYDLALYRQTFPNAPIEGRTFTIEDHNGFSVTFEFTMDDTVTGNNVPVFYDLDPLNDPNLPTSAFNVATSIITSIEFTDLDVDIFRGDVDNFFIEGAVRLAAEQNTGTALLPIGAPVPFITRKAAQQGAIPFGKIVNNTLVGRGGSLHTGTGAIDVGILIEDNARPTLLNNIVANFHTGLQSDNSSRDQNTDIRTFVGSDSVFFGITGTLTTDDFRTSPTKYVGTSPTVIGGTIYQGNLVNTQKLGLGDAAIVLAADTSPGGLVEPLFVNISAGNYLLAAGSRAIDSSVDSLQERNSLNTVVSAVGISPSPILAPNTDLTGQLRVDDPSVEPPAGFGRNVFKDRGALERADFAGPLAVMIDPLDNGASPGDVDPADSFVTILGRTVDVFRIQIVDGVAPADPAFGTGADDLTVTSDAVSIYRDGVLLIENEDYVFSYDSTNNVIRLRPLAGAWASESTYEIVLDNQANGPSGGIRDLSNNLLQPNRNDGTTTITVALGTGYDYGDAPDPTFPTLNASNGARHVLVEGVYLGAGVDPEVDGAPSENGLGDGADDGIRFDTMLSPGLRTEITVTASTNGFVSGWIDLNGDGDWNDSGERIFTNIPVFAGGNTLELAKFPAATVLSSATSADVFARFRFSTAPVAAVTGEAPDGEVEDYRVTITGNPWRNVAQAEDVNDDGFVSPLDAILVINELDAPVISHPITGELPIPVTAEFNPPPYLDVNGDGILSPIDALIVINALPTSAARAPLADSATGELPQQAVNEAAPSNRDYLPTPTIPTAGLAANGGAQRAAAGGRAGVASAPPRDYSVAPPPVVDAVFSMEPRSAARNERLNAVIEGLLEQLSAVSQERIDAVRDVFGSGTAGL